LSTCFLLYFIVVKVCKTKGHQSKEADVNIIRSKLEAGDTQEMMDGADSRGPARSRVQIPSLMEMKNTMKTSQLRKSTTMNHFIQTRGDEEQSRCWLLLMDQ
ncbi:hypothetical protein XENOCAPTIV_015579, partial [Xenoophorus captivus]